ncbi:unnamed protein product (macronuclear) [Paramecium tetraurelia]|uniref:Transmembrane protein n=1 Tax=Paramecium tetraurelia TaxID=5888 RepID=A0BU17_PARTE|nr:uncharacterized protein GSPATT00032266001 [Paramecium tetraurelia]CAK62034.1 unnamed protein product [Paramecium tetraurelia]|eukprot:XP_001429432.1 hypothetical protein (macronuclear) [Paramecium tetraurelia strain d4-2]
MKDIYSSEILYLKISTLKYLKNNHLVVVFMLLIEALISKLIYQILFMIQLLELLKPIALQVNFNFTNVTFQDVFSNDGNIAKLNFISYNQLLYMQNCRILQTIEGYSKFRSLFSSSQKYETTMFSVQQGYLILRDIFVQLYLNIFLQLNYQSKVSLTSIEIDYSYYYQNSIMQISFSADQQCKIEITNLKIKNFKLYKNDPKLQKIQIKQVFGYQQKLSQDCKNQQLLKLINSTYELINLSDYIAEPQNQIESLVQITNVKNKDSISIKSSQFSNNQCQFCQSGLIFIKLIELQSENVILSNIWLMDNQCGENGCLCIVQEFQSQDQKKMSTLTLDTMFCYRNQAKKGGCIVSQQVGLKITNSILSENLAVEQGGSIYYDGEQIYYYRITLSCQTQHKKEVQYIQATKVCLNQTKLQTISIIILHMDMVTLVHLTQLNLQQCTKIYNFQLQIL